MQKFNRVMIVIDWLAAVTCAILLLLPMFALAQETATSDTDEGTTSDVGPSPSAFTGLQWLVTVIGVVLLALNVLWLVLAARGLGGEEYVGTQTSGGQVKTAVSAIEDSLTRTAIQQPEVSGARVRVLLKPDRKTPARIVGNVSFVEIPNQIGAQQVLQGTLLARFKEIVDLPEDLPVDINVVRFASKKKADRKGDAADKGDDKKGESQDDFRGPRYPVGG